MKIAMIGHKRIPSREGGVERVVEELAVRMAKEGHEIYVYNRKGKHVSDKNLQMEELKSYKGVNIISIPTIESKSLNAVIYICLATIHALTKKYDVIHFHAEGACAFIWLTKLLGIRSVVTIHGLDWQRAKWGGFATRFLKYSEKMAVKYADEIIVLSQTNAEYFLQEYNRKTVYIPNGINQAVRRKANLIKKQFGLEGQDFILFLARIVPEKGLEYLIEAFEKNNMTMKLVIAGGSSHSDEYYQRIISKCRKNTKIIFTGFVQGAILDELFTNCALYVLPSDIEGMPISLMEAMSYGCRCLVSDIPENVAVIGCHGETFKRSDVNDLAMKLSILLREGENSQDIQCIIEYITKKYQWEKIVKQTIEVYKRKKNEHFNYK